jgi:predicted transcriptional regulator
MAKPTILKQNIYNIQEDIQNTFNANLEQGEGDNNGINVSVRVVGQRAYLPPNVMLFQKPALYIATEIKEPSVCRVLVYFLGLSEYENYLSIDIDTIAGTLSLSKRTVVRCLNILVEQNIIIKIQHPIDKRRHDYFINPLSAWKGNSNARNKKIKQLEKIDKTQLKLGYDFDQTK